MLYNEILRPSLTSNIDSKSSRAGPGRRAPVLSPDSELVLAGCLPVQLPRHPDNMNIAHGVHSEVTALVPICDGDYGLASVLLVQVSHGDDGDQVTNPGRLVNLGLILPLVGEVTEVDLRIVIILILLAELSRISAVDVLSDPRYHF